MYDVVVIGQGLSGLLSAIWAKEQGLRTALVAAGAGKIMQSTGVMDLIPGSDGGINEWMEIFQRSEKLQLSKSIEQFKKLMKRIGYPYKGDIDHPINFVTGAGNLKKTTLYPETIAPIPLQGHVVVVGFEEVIDFQPAFIKGNLIKAQPNLKVDSIKIQLGKQSQRTMTQLDAGRILDKKEVRSYCINQIKKVMTENNISQPDMFIFPSSLGVENWKETIEQFSNELKGVVTEAPGMPPNATAIRFYEQLKKEAIRLGVRFYSDTTVVGCMVEEDKIRSLMIKIANKVTELNSKQFILATGGILGGGLEVTPDGLKETSIRLDVDSNGQFLHCPLNLFPVGASKSTLLAHNGITGGIYSIFSSFEIVDQLKNQSALGGSRSA